MLMPPSTQRTPPPHSRVSGQLTTAGKRRCGALHALEGRPSQNVPAALVCPLHSRSILLRICTVQTHISGSARDPCMRPTSACPCMPQAATTRRPACRRAAAPSPAARAATPLPPLLLPPSRAPASWRSSAPSTRGRRRRRRRRGSRSGTTCRRCAQKYQMVL